MEHPTREVQIASLKQLGKFATIFIEKIGASNILKVKIDEGSGHDDPLLFIGDVACAAYCRLLDRRLGFILGHMIYDSGTRYYPDGSGEPPSQDFTEDHTIHNPGQAALKLISMAFDVEIQIAAEAYDIEQLAKEEKAFDRAEAESILDVEIP